MHPLRRRIEKLTRRGPGADAFRAALAMILDSGTAPDGPAGDFARQVVADLAAMDATIPAAE